MKLWLKILIIFFILVVVGTSSYFVYKKFIYEEPMELSFEVDVYSKKSLFDYNNEIPCNLKKDEEINTD